jgi:hypothetical protein
LLIVGGFRPNTRRPDIESKMRSDAAAVPLSTLCKDILDPEKGYRRDLLENAALEFQVDVRTSPNTVLSSKQIVDTLYKKRFAALSALAQEMAQARLGYLRKRNLPLADADLLPAFIYVPQRAANSLGQRLKTDGFARVTAEDRYMMGLVARVDQHFEQVAGGGTGRDCGGAI